MNRSLACKLQWSSWVLEAKAVLKMALFIYTYIYTSIYDAYIPYIYIAFSVVKVRSAEKGSKFKRWPSVEIYTYIYIYIYTYIYIYIYFFSGCCLRLWFTLGNNLFIFMIRNPCLNLQLQGLGRTQYIRYT